MMVCEKFACEFLNKSQMDCEMLCSRVIYQVLGNVDATFNVAINQHLSIFQDC
jgi:hypothetical protein